MPSLLLLRRRARGAPRALQVLLSAAGLLPDAAPTPAAMSRPGPAACLVLGQPDFETRPAARTIQQIERSCPTPDRLLAPFGVACDPTSGAIFVADTWNHRVLRFPDAAALANGAKADLVLGQPDFRSRSYGVGRNELYFPESVAVDPTSGALFVADTWNHRVLRFGHPSALVDGASADAVFGQANATMLSAAATPCGMQYPSGVTVDADGRLWVADTDNHRVLRFDTAAAKADGAPADAVLGQCNGADSKQGRNRRSMAFPAGLTVDSGGRLWVADSHNHRVLRFDAAAAKANGVSADGILGAGDGVVSTDAATPRTLAYPRAVAVDADGRLWVADTEHNRVLRFDAAATKEDDAPADGVLGQGDFAASGWATAQRGMFAPRSVVVDGAGRVWVADTDNSRVVSFNCI